MPTPVGHALAGLAVAGLAGRRSNLPASHVGALIGCSLAPDLDLILRFVDGANHHRGPTHSVTAALLAGLIGAALARLRFDAPKAWAISAAWGSHVLLDYLGVDTSPPSGEMALWPISSAFFVSPIQIFYDVPRAFTLVATMHNLQAVSIEVVVMAPIAWFVWRGPRLLH